jgi:hypothetical protein
MRIAVKGLIKLIGLPYYAGAAAKSIPRNIFGLAFKSFVRGILHRC